MSDEETLVGEMAAQEAAALDYQPELKVSSGGEVARVGNDDLTGAQGPLVGCKKSSMHITAEYANADPTFVEKTKVCLFLECQAVMSCVHAMEANANYSDYRKRTATTVRYWEMVTVDGEV